MQWPNVDGKNILELYDNPKTPPSDKAVLHEYIEKTNERNEELDSDVQKNTSSLTWSILTKSQSVVAEMIKINQYGFDGKDSDAKQNMEDFSQNMKKVIPGGVVTQTQAKFFVEKFFNRFSVFSWNNKTELLKRLTRCQQHPSSSDVEHIMYYSIVGEIVGSISSRDALLPPELEWALNAWKNFFKNNLNTILSPDVVASSFGNQHKDELLNLSKKENRPELYPWEEASQLLDGQESTIYINTRSSNEEKEQARKKRESLKWSNTKYINWSLYVLAEALSKKCSWFANNRFKMLGENKAPSSKSSAKATWAKINNPEIIDKVRQVLEWKNITDDNSYIPTEDYDEYSY